MRLQNKVAVVTGAAQGIGRAVAERFAQEEAKYTSLYVAEFQFRYNNQTNEDIFGTALIKRC